MYENRTIKVLNKIISTGIMTSQQFLKMSGADIVYSIPTLEADEFPIVIKIQDSIRNGNLFDCLCGKENFDEQENID